MPQYIKNTVKRTPLSKEELKRVLSDFAYFCERCILISDKNGKKVPLKLNRAQTIFADALLDYIFAKKPKPKTFVILKARQMGYTTVLMALEVYVMIKFPNNEYAALNLKHFLHKGDIAREIMEDKMLPMIENLHPTVFGDFTQSKRDMMFHCHSIKGKRRNNKIRFFTARAEESGRGGTAQFIILDEAAFYPNLIKIQNGAVSSLPSSGLALLVYVSTANGFNGFYDMCQLAKTSPNMEFLFLPWFLMEEYIADPEGVDYETLAPHEIKIVEAMKEWNEKHPSYEIAERLFLGKIAWYRNELVQKKGNDLKAMQQEFPSTEDEPFASSDAPVFPSDKIIPEIKRIKDSGEDILGFGVNNVRGDFIEGTKYDVKVFKKPEIGRRYILTVDPAFGGETSDNTAIRMNDLMTLEDMAVYTSKSTPEDLAPLIVSLAKYYNSATVNVENNRGELLINLIRQEYRYSNIYIDPTRKFDRANPNKSYGTKIHETTKRRGIERLRYLLNSGKYIPKDEDTLQELLHYSYVGKGSARKAQATGNKDDGTPYHDDLVMGLVNFTLSLPNSMFISIEKNNKL